MSSQFESVAELPKEAKQPFYDLMLVLADNKHLLGLRYGEWLGAPAIEASISAVSMAQDEFGHARLFYGIITEFVKQGSKAREEVAKQYRNIEILDSEFESWMDFIAANLLVDLALTVQIEAFQDSSYLPMRRMIGKITQEEEFHLQHAHGWLMRLTQESEKSRLGLEKSIKKIWTPVLHWLGNPESRSEKILLETGLQKLDSEALRNRFVEVIGPLAEEAGLDLPISGDAVTGEWLLATALSWKGWDEAFRRSSKTGPDATTFAQIDCFHTHSYPVGS
jgi:ring-1,2-phenylacetyl-CoA epoxidase subunit PaaC